MVFDVQIADIGELGKEVFFEMFAPRRGVCDGSVVGRVHERAFTFVKEYNFVCSEVKRNVTYSADPFEELVDNFGEGLAAA